VVPATVDRHNGCQGDDCCQKSRAPLPFKRLGPRHPTGRKQELDELGDDINHGDLAMSV
jgi:hypothetical protein